METLRKLNQRQKQAVTHIKGPLLVIAGAGTGKTKVITHRISHIINQGVNPSNILAVTFTNKAAQEMKERVDHLINNQRLNRDNISKQKPTIGTFHAISADILRKHGSLIKIPANFKVIGEKKGSEIIESSIKYLKLDLKQFKPSYVQNFISREKSAINRENQHDNSSPFMEKTNLIMEKYEKALKKIETLDFDDLIIKTVLLFKQHPETLELYQNKWSYIHIDEYQDTDQAQFRLINFLADKGSNICAVGDEDQSIYGFRGADLANILNFEQTWPGASVIMLERNYRSTKTILDAANAIIAKNEIRRKKNLFTKEKKGPKIEIFEAKDEREEAENISEKIHNLLKKRESSMAVLCRANFQFTCLEKVFNENSVPYQKFINQDNGQLLDPNKNEDKTVRLMTVHAAKGLEFKYVFIPGLEKGLFPHSFNEEERRLFYVALTRGQEKIFLSWSRYRAVFGSKQINQPSPFLSDIPNNLIK